MQIIVPKTITDAVLISSTVDENEFAEWSVSTAYSIGDQVILAALHKVYKCLVANTGKKPDEHLAGTTPEWMEIGYTNRWKMFDPYVGTQTQASENIVVVLDGGRCDSVAVFGCGGTALTVEVLVGGEVFHTQTRQLLQQNAGSWADYFFGDIVLAGDVSFLTPIYGAAQYRITVEGATAKIGNLVIGRRLAIGDTLYGATLGILSFSKKVTDEAFGTTYLKKGNNARRGSLPVGVRNNRLDYVGKILAGLDGMSLVFLCDDSPEPLEIMQIFGFYRDWNIEIPGPNYSKCSLEIEGLI